MIDDVGYLLTLINFKYLILYYYMSRRNFILVHFLFKVTRLITRESNEERLDIIYI